MIKELMYKWFGLSDMPCNTCEVLREQLHRSDAERRELLNRLLDKDRAEPPSTVEEKELKPVGQQFVPWRVRQQMLEQEDRRAAQILRERTQEIEELEKELGVKEDVASAPV